MYLQRLDIWGRELLPDEGPFNQLEVYAKADPEWVQLTSLADWRTMRASFRKWAVAPSDDAGRWALRDPVPIEAEAATSLLSRSCPLVIIVEELKRRGWRLQGDGTPLGVLVTPHPNVISKRRLHQRCKAYFQCLVKLPELFELGLQRFHHSYPARFYELLLRSPNPAGLDPKMGAAAIDEELEKLPEQLGGQQRRPGDSDDSVVGSQCGDLQGEFELEEDEQGSDGGEAEGDDGDDAPHHRE